MNRKAKPSGVGQWFKKNMLLFMSILMTMSSIAVFGPLELYFTNYSEFWFEWKDVFRISVILSVCSFLIFLFIGLLLRGKARELYSLVLFALGIALYIQGNYANMDYGVLDGREVDWGAYPVYAFLDTAGWILLFAIMIFLWLKKRAWSHKVQMYGSLYVILIQIITLGVLLIGAGKEVFHKSDYYLSNEGIYDVSSEENIIIFVLDAFDNAYFQEILEEDAEKYQEIFSDFVYFSDAAAGGSRTKIGVPIIVTGEHYPGKITYSEYIEDSFDQDGLYTEMKKKNYDIRLYTDSLFVPDDSGSLVNNQESTGFGISSYGELSTKYLSLVLYKYMPHILKEHFEIYTADFDQYKEGNSAQNYVRDDGAYYKGLQEGLAVREGKNVFRLFHLNGAHPPYCINEEAEVVDSENTDVISQAKGALHIVEEYISQLKELGVYDSAAIYIMADHGDTDPAHGILLAKRKGEKAPLKEKKAPVSYFDLHASIFSAIGISNGDDLFDIQEDAARTRYFYQGSTGEGSMQVTEYAINGKVSEEGARERTGVILKEDKTGDKTYQLGTKLTFGSDNNVSEYIISGLSFTDAGDYSWTDGNVCEMEFWMEQSTDKGLMVSLDIMAVYLENGAQELIIYANERQVFSEVITQNGTVTFQIPNEVFADEQKLSLKLELPNAVVPQELFGSGYDTRKLGIAIKGLLIEELDKEGEEKSP